MERPADLKPSISSQSWRRDCGIEAGGRLVQEEQLGVADQGAGQRQPLLLAAGERAHPGLGLLPELHHGDDVVRRRAALVEAAEELHRLLHGELLRELGLLERDAEPLAQLAVVRAPAAARARSPRRRRGCSAPRRSRWSWSCPHRWARAGRSTRRRRPRDRGRPPRRHPYRPCGDSEPEGLSRRKAIAWENHNATRVGWRDSPSVSPCGAGTRCYGGIPRRSATRPAAPGVRSRTSTPAM